MGDRHYAPPVLWTRIDAPIGALVLALALSGAGCGGPQQGRASAGDLPHLGTTWFPYRAQALEISVAEARARDAALSEAEPPEDLDAVVIDEAAAIWRSECARCHGPEGRLRGVDAMDPMPRAWGGMGARMGFFFGGDKMRAGIYSAIADGKEDEVGRLVMPAWRGLLSREQMWALVRHIEGF